ncbi:hypothetical protein CVS40_11070 [Lucilia cuprina]|nr:hypothetical protein CVS40_11070 [Lucilia cuprina]
MEPTTIKATDADDEKPDMFARPIYQRSVVSISTYNQKGFSIYQNSSLHVEEFCVSVVVENHETGNRVRSHVWIAVRQATLAVRTNGISKETPGIQHKKVSTMLIKD